MIHFFNIINKVKNIVHLTITKIMKRLELDWILKSASTAEYVGHGKSDEKFESDSYELYSCF